MFLMQAGRQWYRQAEREERKGRQYVGMGEETGNQLQRTESQEVVAAMQEPRSEVLPPVLSISKRGTGRTGRRSMRILSECSAAEAHREKARQSMCGI